MKIKQLLLIAVVILTGAALTSTCKKSTVNPIQSLLASGTWQLASKTTTYYTGNSTDSTITNTDSCTEILTFNKDLSCSYTNFECIEQNSTGQWSLTTNNLFLNTTITCRDTSAAGSSMPFSYAQINALGQFSLILITGDFGPHYSTTQSYKTITYGFVRTKTAL